MPNSIEILPINASHLPFCNTIAKDAPDPWLPQDIASELALINHTGLVAISYDTVAGFAFFYKNDTTVDLLQVVVAENFRGNGIASFLLNSAFDIFESQGIKNILLEVRMANLPAINLYNKLGFKIISLRKNLYKNPSEDGYLMQKLF